MTIFPSNYHQQVPNYKEYLSKYVLAYNRTQNIHYQPTKQSLPSSLTGSIVWNPKDHPEFSKISIQYHNVTEINFFPLLTEHSVCIVQTFRNYMTPMMLYLCLEYYLSLGWSIILFDRKGNHKEIIEQKFYKNSRILYYPFTIYELIYPERYSSLSQEATTEVQC